MPDFDNLTSQQKTLLTIKLDGYVEAAVQAARLHGIGLSEALSLTALALLREIVAHGMSGEKAADIWADAFGQTFPSPGYSDPPTLN